MGLLRGAPEPKKTQGPFTRRGSGFPDPQRLVGMTMESEHDELCGESGGADVYAERVVEGCGAAADESRLGGDERAAGVAAAAMARLEVIADTYLSMNAPVQWAVPALLEQRKNIQRQLMERVHTNLAELDRRLAGQKSCQRLSVEGGWYAVLRVPVTRSDEELAIELVREKSVLVHPGHFYDFPSDGYLVLSLITAEGEFKEGIGNLLLHLSS